MAAVTGTPFTLVMATPDTSKPGNKKTTLYVTCDSNVTLRSQATASSQPPYLVCACHVCSLKEAYSGVNREYGGSGC